MSSYSRKRNKLLIVASTLLFLFIVLIGMPHSISAGMLTEQSTAMSDCPFSLGLSICNMSFSSHLLRWQKMTEFLPLNYLAFLAVLAVVSVSTERFLKKKLEEIHYGLARHVIRSMETFVSVPLQNFFSRGILHPKLFS